jgi:TRAP-type transport system periplasmic protein
MADRRSFLSGLAATAGLVAMPYVARAESPAVLKIGTSTINDLQHDWMKTFAGLVEAKTSGSITVEIYPASQLGSAPRMIEATQLGAIQGFVGPPEFLSGVDNRFAVLGAPCLFKSEDHADRVLKHPAVRETILALGADKGLKGVSLFLYGPAILTFRTPSPRLADFAGKKIRVFASAMQMETIAALKATAVPMPLSEVIPALQQGTIDGLMSALPVLDSLHFFDSAKFVVETGHASLTTVCVLSRIWYDGLDPAAKAALDAAGAQADVEIRARARETLTKSRTSWLSHGGSIESLPPEDQAELVALLRPIGDRVTAGKPEERSILELVTRTAAQV